MNKIALAFSPNFFNKENRAVPRKNQQGELSNAYAHGAFTTVNVFPMAIIQHLTAGKAISVAALSEKWRHEKNFVSSQVMGIDFDQSPGIAKLLEDEFVRQYAFLIYPTASHTEEAPRSRVMFILDAPITDKDCYKRLIKRLMHRFSVPLDESCKDVVRIFYGSDKRGAHTAPERVLPLAVLEALAPHPDELKAEREHRPETVAADLQTKIRRERWALATKDRIMRDALSVPKGGGRHNAFNAAAMAAVSKSKGGWETFESVDADLRWLGAQMDLDEGEVDRSIRGAWSKADAEALVLPADENIKPAQQNSVATPPDAKNGVSSAPVSTAPPLPTTYTWRTSDDGLDRYAERYAKGRGTNKMPILFPFKSLHRFSGLAHVMDRGYLIGIVGLSGGTKTSFVECLTEPLRQMGANGLWWGIEWSWEKMADRAMQRHGGATVTEMMLHEMYLDEERLNVPPARRYGTRLPQSVANKTTELIKEMKTWSGKNHQLEEVVTDVDALLVAFANRIAELEAAGVEIAYAVFDYMQLLDLYSVRNEGDRINAINGKLKQFCVTHQLIGFVVSQVTKSNAANAKAGASVLEAESGQFMRSDKFNLVLTLNPIWTGGLLTNQGVLNVAKNSLGTTGKAWLYIDPSHLQWTDVEVEADKRITENLSEVDF